jgi:hypothetical protein
MGKLFTSTRIVGIAFLQLVGINQAADPAKPDPASIERQRQASALVGQSLQAEMDGDCVGREHFLKEALSVSDQYAPARWYRGQVSQVDGTWLSVDDTVQYGISL